jgi:hypothetical protein
MTRLPAHHKLCTISHLPYQAFRWKAGPNGRYKETVISYVVAADRNICQCCLMDLRYGLPVGVRDALLAKPDNRIAAPTSLVGQQYFYTQKAAELAEEGYNPPETTHPISLQVANMEPSRQLDNFSKHLYAGNKSSTAFRNLPKLCSFWLNGSCTRVARGTCPYRPCCGNTAYAFPEIASDKELCRQFVDRLKVEGADAVQRTLDQEIRQALQQALKGNREDAMRKRISGDDDLTEKYLRKLQSTVRHLPSRLLAAVHICTARRQLNQCELNRATSPPHGNLMFG